MLPHEHNFERSVHHHRPPLAEKCCYKDEEMRYECLLFFFILLRDVLYWDLLAPQIVQQLEQSTRHRNLVRRGIHRPQVIFSHDLHLITSQSPHEKSSSPESERSS